MTPLEMLYEQAFPPVARMVRQLGGDQETARDLFHDAVIIYLEKPTAAQRSEVAYIKGIARHLWYRQYRQGPPLSPLTDAHEAISVPDDFYDREQLPLLQTGQKCLALLKAFYYDGLPISEVARRFQYRSEHSASVQKYKCLEKVREEVKKAHYETTA
jgi:DNA-directed RNA polymerase specialized sigma24 family protein